MNYGVHSVGTERKGDTCSVSFKKFGANTRTRCHRASDLIGTVRDPSVGFGLHIYRRARASMLLWLETNFGTLVNAITWVNAIT